MEFKIWSAVFPSFAIALLGYVYSRVDKELHVKSVANLIYYLFSPCLVFASIAKRPFQVNELLLLGGSSFVLILVMAIIVMFYKKAVSVEEKGFYLPVIFMNTGNIALPMALFLYGNLGLSKAILFHLVNVMILYSLGVFLVSSKTDLRQFFKIPFLYAAVLGMIVANISVPLPEGLQSFLGLVSTGIEEIGKGSVPLLIISLGYSLNRTKISDLRDGLVGAGLRVLLGPAMAFGLVFLYRHLGWVPLEGLRTAAHVDARTTEAIIILMAAMPAPIASYLLNEKFENCPEKAASMVLIGTLAGVVTIPLVLRLSFAYVYAP
ncbi:MAG: AEC family transporter [Deltaproteobacteria bacterium]|nr:AEC family transporter [Deltaproteobacteria bacterium]